VHFCVHAPKHHLPHFYFIPLKAFAMQTAQFQLHAEIEQKHWWFVARRQILRQIVAEILPPSRATVILDVGCGTGGNIADLAADYSCVGIDTSAEAIQLAKKRFPDVQFICGTAPADVADILPQVRLILLMDVLEHVADDKALLANLVLAAEPGTYFLITVPADRKLWSGHDVAFGHFRRYEAVALEELWANLPVSPMLVSHFNSRLYPLVKMARFMSRRRGKTGGAAGTDFRLPGSIVNRTLARAFAGESRQLIATLGKHGAGYRKGVSLLAVLQRQTAADLGGATADDRSTQSALIHSTC
jgi:SAM-dependent methyltransferase